MKKEDKFEFNEDLKQVLLGSLLGDGCLPNDKGARNTRFSEKHGLKQKYYLFWKKNIFDKELNFGKIIIDRKIINIRSCVDKRLNYFRQKFYKENRKRITKNILDQLELLALVVWYCDDGTYNYREYFCEIFLHNLSNYEIPLIKNYFKEKWDLQCKIDINIRNNYYIHFDANNTKKFLALIKPVFIEYKIPKCMWYKLGRLYNGNKKRVIVALRKKREVERLWYHNSAKAKKTKENYYLLNKKKILQQRKVYCQIPEVKERIRKRMKDYYKKYYQRNRDKINAHKREWRRKRKLVAAAL